MSALEVGPRKLRRDEGRIAFEVLGEGPLVVLIPGMGELRSSYRYNTSALAEAGFRAAAMDLRGHGDSDASFTRYDDALIGGDALAIATELDGPALLVGNSTGAAAAVWAAFERPDLVAGVVLISPLIHQAPLRPLIGWAQRAALSGPWAPWAWRARLSSRYPGRRPADFEAHRAAILADLRRPGHARALTAMARASHASASGRLPYLECPALVVAGTADMYLSDAAAEAAWIVDRLPETGQLLVQGAGHYPQAEEPHIVNQALVAFAQKVLTTA
ncbi:alpha/beta fold hydrolase [Sinomonas soli]